MNFPRTFSFVLLGAICLSSEPVRAQVAWIYRGAAAVPVVPPSPSFMLPPPPPVPCPFGPTVASIAPVALAANAAPLGGLAFDETTNLLAFSTGPTITIRTHPSMPALVPPVAAGPYAVPAAASAASPGGVFGGITGMAAGFVPLYGSVLWVTDGRAIMGLSMIPPLVIRIAPFAIAAAPAGSPLISGLEYDMLSASLWACNTTGACFNVSAFPTGFPGGGGVAAGATLTGPLMPMVAPAGVVVGCVRDTRDMGAGLWVTDGAALYPVIVPMGAAVPIPAGPGTAYGASFVAENLALPSGGGCIGAVPLLGVSRVSTWGGFVPFSVNITGGFAGAPSLLGVDFTCVPGGIPLSLFGGTGTWWLPLGTVILVGPFLLDPAGAAAIPIGLSSSLLGLRALAQGATICALTGALTVTPAISFTIAMP